MVGCAKRVLTIVCAGALAMVLAGCGADPLAFGDRLADLEKLGKGKLVIVRRPKAEEWSGVCLKRCQK